MTFPSAQVKFETTSYTDPCRFNSSMCGATVGGNAKMRVQILPETTSVNRSLFSALLNEYMHI